MEVIFKIGRGVLDQNLVFFEPFGGDRGLAAESMEKRAYVSIFAREERI
jgi:hypothetical protein